MPRDHINLMKPNKPTSLPPAEPPPHKGRAYVVGAVVVVAVLGFGIATIGGSSQKISPYPGLLQRVRSFITGAPLGGMRGESRGRINLLLLGMGGEGHDGPYLTDTMILASVSPEMKRVGLLTIPRDIVANIPGYGYRKINNANAFGEVKGRGQGLELARQVVSDTFGLPIDYVVRLDFSGFDELIDAVGGVNVNVERSFTDASYPLEDGSGKSGTIHFNAGVQHMNGKAALKFVRSRHGTNGEASDFARSRRQERILLALRDKALGSLISPQYIASLYTALQKNVATDMGIGEMVRFFSLAKDFSSYTVTTKMLTEGPGAPLLGRITSEGAYVLEPRGFDYGILRDAAANLLVGDNERPGRPRVEVQNGTTIAGAAAVIADTLKPQGFDVVRVRNAARRDVPKTVIFDLTSGAKANELARLKVLLDAPALPLTAEVASRLPTSTAEAVVSVSKDIDFLVIIGPDQHL